MQEYELKKLIGQSIHFHIAPHYGWKEREEGIGVLDYYAEQGWWLIRLTDGREFLLKEEMLKDIEFDRHEQMLLFMFTA